MTKEQALGRLISLDARDREDVRFLGEVVDGLATQHHAIFAAALLENDLMRLQNWPLRIAVWVIRKRGRSLFDAMMSVYAKQPAVATELVERASEHIVFGKDTSDKNSAGGWNQREIQECVKILLVMAGLGETREAN